MDRRRFLGTLGLAATAPGLAACGSREGSAGPDAGRTATPGAPTPAATRQVRHRYGTTTVSGSPRRVVTLGQTDHDATIALGVVPVAVGGFLGGSYSPFRPWNSAGLDVEPPVLDMMEIAFEKVAALAPDLIIAAMSGVTKEDHAKLSRIAPTVAQPVDAEDRAVPYASHTAHVGQALGRPAEAERLVAELDSAFADVRAANPSLAGRTAICAKLNGGDYDVLAPTGSTPWTAGASSPTGSRSSRRCPGSCVRPTATRPRTRTPERTLPPARQNTAARTDSTSGRWAASCVQESPSSRLHQTVPSRAPR